MIDKVLYRWTDEDGKKRRLAYRSHLLVAEYFDNDAWRCHIHRVETPLIEEIARLAERINELEYKKQPGPGGCISVKELGNECFADDTCEPNCAVKHLLEKNKKLEADVRRWRHAIETDID